MHEYCDCDRCKAEVNEWLDSERKGKAKRMQSKEFIELYDDAGVVRKIPVSQLTTSDSLIAIVKALGASNSVTLTIGENVTVSSE